ncbi:UDP-glucuronosyltransferase 2B7-like [Contarinia nasturtii]|uniref:UDP-glucuronosyltransferase 2B7-like n=1 Tax=Contarinia nasturtii TaxID=265458 RepID=UPI0012D392A4|nr:UDP-glucuronosyltransferase 2B7-like [Contarinia nasturtii]
MKCILIFMLVLISVPICLTSNILYLQLLESHSHHFWNSAISDELAKRGHNITILSPDSEAKPPKGVHYILLENMYDTEYKTFYKGLLNTTESMNPFREALAIVECCEVMCSAAVRTMGFQTLLNYPDDFKFDLILHDFSVGSCFLPFIHKFNYPPMIAVTAYGHPSYLNQFIADHHHYSYVPHNLLPFNDEMTFSQRLLNFLIYMQEFIIFKYFLNPRLDEIATEYFGPDFPSVSELEKRTSLAFVNTNSAIDYHVSHPENVIPVGGLQIKDPKPFPQELKSFIDSSKKGTVIFALGSNIRSDCIPQMKKNLILKVLSDLPDYNFLWKFESNISESDLPKNVMIRSWIPVSDVLAHPKVKAIFFHGGLLTTHEAIWRSVPMIIMPFGLDQRKNLIKTKRFGISEGIEYHSLNYDDLKTTILKVLKEPSYAMNMQKVSARFKDQKEKPLDRAIWWIEWLLRNPDCDHLKSPVFRLGLIVGNSYDIIAFIILLVTVILIISLKLFSYCIRKCSRNIYSEETMPHRKSE